VLLRVRVEPAEQVRSRYLLELDVMFSVRYTYYPQSNGKSKDGTEASRSIVSGQAARSASRKPLD
jgi:hypothetical protein